METKQTEIVGAIQANNESPIIREIDIGNEMVLAEVRLEKLKDSDINARIMSSAQFNVLADNIRRRGRLESVLYCAQPDGKGPVTIVSGHNRRRAALAADIQTAWVLIDRAQFTRSQLIAKQLAHNALVGADDTNILAEMVKLLDNADDLLASGINPDDVKLDDKFSDVQLLTPTLEFEQKTLAFAFLPHQVNEIEKYLGHFDQTVDLMIVGHESQWEDFVRKVAGFARIKNIRSGGTAIAELIKVAEAERDKFLKQVEKQKAEQAMGATESDPRTND